MKNKQAVLTYYAYAENKDGKLEQLFVIRKDGKLFRQEWTGKIYCDQKEANQDMISLNCGSEAPRPFATRHVPAISSTL